MSREDRYHKKDNWGMNESDPSGYPSKEKEYEEKVEERFYTQLIIYGKSIKIKKTKNSKTVEEKLFRSYGNLFMDKETVKLIIDAYQSCFGDNVNQENKEELIRLKLQNNLKQAKIKKSFQNKIFTYDRLFQSPDSMIKKATKKELEESFYNVLCGISRCIIPIQDQSAEAYKLLDSYNNSFLNHGTVVAIFNAYYLCCEGTSSRKEKNKCIKENLEICLINNKVDVVSRNRILSVEEII